MVKKCFRCKTILKKKCLRYKLDLGETFYLNGKNYDIHIDVVNPSREKNDTKLVCLNVLDCKKRLEKINKKLEDYNVVNGWIDKI